MFNLIKKENGNVLVAGVGQNYILPQECKVARLGDTQYIEISQEGRVIFGFDYSQLEFYKIDPDPTLYPKFQDIDLFITGVLAVDFFKPNQVDAGIIDGALIITGETSYTFLGSENNTVIAGLDNVAKLYIDPSVAAITWTGLKAPTNKKEQTLFVINEGANGISLVRESASSDPENRFYGEGAGTTIGVRKTIHLVYDTNILTGRWRYF